MKSDILYQFSQIHLNIWFAASQPQLFGLKDFDFSAVAPPPLVGRYQLSQIKCTTLLLWFAGAKPKQQSDSQLSGHFFESPKNLRKNK